MPPHAPPSTRAWVAADRRLDLAVMQEQLAPDVVLASLRPLAVGLGLVERHLTPRLGPRRR